MPAPALDPLATTAASLARDLAAWTTATVEALQRHHLPRWRIPRAFAGHEVGADVRADLCFTLTHLAEAGVGTVAGEPVDTVLGRLLGEVDGRSTHTFFSYRIAETLSRHGRFEGNPLLAGLDDDQRGELVEAVDSSDWLELLDAGVLPRNYAAVLARCEQGRLTLGLDHDEAEERVTSLLDRAREMLTANAERTLDDSNDRVGRYDIYTADVWLFCEPLAPRLGGLWSDGFTRALDLVRAVGARDGSAVAWGRSVGDLSAALTLEMAALALARGLDPDHASLWLRRALDAAATVTAGFDADGVTTAHVRRAQDAYRGPARRLQLTLDLLGKVAWAAALLRQAPPTLAPASVAEAYPRGDRWIGFEAARPAGAWAHRSAGADLVVPFVGITRSHYLPAPFQPGTWEVPNDRDLPTWTPLVTAGLSRHTAGGLPSAVTHDEDGLTVIWTGFPISGGGLDGEDPTPPLGGSRTARYRVDGRSLVLSDHLTFTRAPRTVSLAIGEAAGRPLQVEWSCPTPHAATVIPTEGLGEWRSATGEIARVHQIDLDPRPARLPADDPVLRPDRLTHDDATDTEPDPGGGRSVLRPGRLAQDDATDPEPDPAVELRYEVRVTPLLRMATSEPDHHYSGLLHEALEGRVVVRPPPIGWRAGPEADLRGTDVFHLHWPEWLGFDDLDVHRSLIARLADADVPVVWTAHNLTPHDRRTETYDPIYQAWAEAVSGVIHHSAWGEARLRARYRFADGCQHAVIPHGHFGSLWGGAMRPDRATAEARLGLAPCALRVGVVGAPRAEKRVQAVLDGVAACHRSDVQVACWSLGADDVVPDDPRIVVAEPYRSVPPLLYATRLAACDVLALVFDAEGDMLGTGTVADAIGLGLPVLRSDWGYLVETLGDAGIACGESAGSIAAALDALDPDTLRRASEASSARQPDTDWATVADATLTLFESALLRAR